MSALETEPGIDTLLTTEDGSTTIDEFATDERKAKYYDNPYQLIDDFEQSETYQKFFARHIDDLRRNRPDKNYDDPDLVNMVKEAFFGGENYVEALHEFYKENKLDMTKLKPEAREKINAYWDYIEKTYNPTIEMIRFRAIDREQEIEQLQALSRRRDLVHIEAAKALYGERITEEDEEKLTNSNLTVGRQLVHLLSCDFEKDVPDPNRERGKQMNRRYNDMAADNLFNR